MSVCALIIGLFNNRAIEKLRTLTNAEYLKVHQKLLFLVIRIALEENSTFDSIFIMTQSFILT